MIGPVSPQREWEEVGEQEEDDISPREERRAGLDGEEQRAEEEQDAEEAQRAKVLRMESAPNAQEVEDHMATHMPFRSWCPYCVAGKAVSDPHRKNDGRGTVPIVSLDYAFMGHEMMQSTQARALSL